MSGRFDEVINRRGTGSKKWDSGQSLIEQGKALRVDDDTLFFYTADMDFRCPDSVREKTREVCEFNLYGYDALTPEIRPEYFEAIVSWMKRRHGWTIRPEEILHVEGTVHALELGIQTFTKPGDGIIIQRPSYPPFAETVEAMGRRVVNAPLVDRDGAFRVDFEAFESAAARPDVTAFILCNPHNPTGRLFTPEELGRMAEICRRHGVFIFADEIHGDLVRRGNTFTPLATVVDGRDLITFTAANKTFNLAGLKTTNVVISDAEIREKYRRAIGKLHPSPFTVAATIGAYNGGEAWLEELIDYLDGTIDAVIEEFRRELPAVRIHRPEGTYILWIDFRGLGMTPEVLRERIYRDANVVLQTGTNFDPENGEGFERMCVAAPRSVVMEAVKRIIDALRK